MITRREVALGGLLTIGWLAAPCACSAASASADRRFGCVITGEEADALFALEGQPTQTDKDNPAFVSSGDRDLDYALAQTLSRLTDAWKVLPGFAYFDDWTRANAYFTPKRYFRRADGSVLFGRRLLANCLKNGESPEAAIIAVAAHEFGHAAQHKNDCMRPLLAGQKTVKRVELHADFIAGFFAGLRKLEKPDFPAAVFATTQYAHGDFNVDRKSHHGTPAERAAAVVKGFEAAFRDRMAPGEGLQVGMRYAQTL
jgi:hypothetical protein